MNTHEFAQALNLLAKNLKANPKMEFDEYTRLSYQDFNHSPLFPKPRTTKGLGLDVLFTFSKLDKKQLMKFMLDNNLLSYVVIRPRDSSWDILGKLVRYLWSNEDARKRLISSYDAYDTSKDSPELLRALNTLLKE